MCDRTVTWSTNIDYCWVKLLGESNENGVDRRSIMWPSILQILPKFPSNIQKFYLYLFILGLSLSETYSDSLIKNIQIFEGIGVKLAAFQFREPCGGPNHSLSILKEILLKDYSNFIPRVAGREDLRVKYTNKYRNSGSNKYQHQVTTSIQRNMTHSEPLAFDFPSEFIYGKSYLHYIPNRNTWYIQIKRRNWGKVSNTLHNRTTSVYRTGQ